MSDVMRPVSGNKLVELRQTINDLREILKKEDDPDKIALLKKQIMEKETNYNILAEMARVKR